MPLATQGSPENANPFSGAGFMRFVRGGIGTYSTDGAAPCDESFNARVFPSVAVTSYSFASPYHTIGFSGITVGANELIGFKVQVATGSPLNAYATIVSNTSNSLIAFDDAPETWALTVANSIALFPYKQLVNNVGLLRITGYGTLSSGTITAGDALGTATLFVWDKQRQKFSIVGPATGVTLGHGVQFEIVTPQEGVYALTLGGFAGAVANLDKVEIRTETAKQFYRS